jgi:ATP-dependent Lon protease
MSDYSQEHDPDYVPEEEDEEDEEEEEEEEYEEDEEEPQFPPQHIIMFIPPPPPKRQKFEHSLSREELEYFDGLDQEEKLQIMAKDQQVREVTSENNMPLRFKILKSDIDPNSKRIILAKLEHVQRMNQGSSEYFKLRNWIAAATRLPIGKYNTLPVTATDPVPKIAEFLNNMRKTLDDTVYGHNDTKDEVIRIFAQWIANPMSKGNVIGIQGPMGCGKTSLVKDGICKALNMPFGFIALGGANDGSFLDGHGFTYEGSTYGKIAEILMKAGVMNPIIFFDELDKISQSTRGEEVTGILTHLTDASQNERFNDKYFGELDLDLSKALIVFSYNDETLVNPILRDRMITIRVSGYKKKDKIVIAQKHLIPSIVAHFNISPSEIVFSDDIIDMIIERVAIEDGVRNLKRGIESIVSWINISRFSVNTETVATFPFTVTREHVRKCIKPSADESAVHLSMYM